MNFFSKGYKDDAGADIIMDCGTRFPAKQMTVFDLGVKFTPNKNTMAIIAPRSSYAKKGLIICNCPVDANYTGNIHAIVYNTSDYDIYCEPGDAFCQLMVVKIKTVKNMDIRKKGKRGNHRFGSTNY